MDDIDRLTRAQQAVLLIRKGLSPRASALRGDPDYARLLALWRADPELRSLVGELAPMLDLQVLDVLPTGIVLAPSGPHSVFAETLSDLRSGLQEMQAGVLALIHVGIAATFFPTTADIEHTAAGGEFSVSPQRVVGVVRTLCAGLEARSADDPEFEDAGLIEAWREIARIPDARPDGLQRAGLGSLMAMVKLVLNQLGEHGMVVSTPTEDGEVYVATPRYRLQVRELAANELYRRCIEACGVRPGA